jgi:hypothetical protein
MARAQAISIRLKEIKLMFTGKTDKPSDEENPPGPVPFNQRISSIIWGQWESTSVTRTMIMNYEILAEEFPPVLEEIRTIAETELKEIQQEAIKSGIPWVPGTIPVWETR